MTDKLTLEEVVDSMDFEKLDREMSHEKSGTADKSRGIKGWFTQFEDENDPTVIRNAVYEFFEPKVGKEAASVATRIVDFLPVLGDVAGFEDAKDALDRQNYVEAAIDGVISTVGLLPVGGDLVQGIFLGIGAKNAPLKELKKARGLLRDRSKLKTPGFNSPMSYLNKTDNPEEVVKELWSETGWVFGPDNKWFFEVPNPSFKIDLNDLDEMGMPPAKISEIVNSDELKKFLPDLDNDGRVLNQPLSSGALGTYSPRTKDIFVNTDIGSNTAHDPNTTFLHELQHKAADLTGLSRGTSSSRFKPSIYEHFKPYTIGQHTVSKRIWRRLYTDSVLSNPELLDSPVELLTRSDSFKTTERGNFLLKPEILEKLPSDVQEHAKSINRFIEVYQDPKLADFDELSTHGKYSHNIGEALAETTARTPTSPSVDPFRRFELIHPNNSKYNIHPYDSEPKFSKGGMVPEQGSKMEEQMKLGFMTDEQNQVDPVSGNEVPPGAKPEEVRDDISARLSEGEFVLPAHVVRFIGAANLYKLINQTEQAIAQMEQSGRMGEPSEAGAPVYPSQPQGQPEAAQMAGPVTQEELEFEEEEPEAPVNFNQGGLAVAPGQDRLGYLPNTPVFSPAGVKLYKDKLGFIRIVPIDGQGKPIADLANELEEIGTSTSTAASTPDTPKSSGENNNDWEGGPHAPQIDVRDLGLAESRANLEQLGSIPEVARDSLTALGMFGGAVGTGIEAAESANAANVAEQQYGHSPFSTMDVWAGGTLLGDLVGLRDPVAEVNYADEVTARGTYDDGSTTADAQIGPSDANPMDFDMQAFDDVGSGNDSDNDGGFGDDDGGFDPGGLY